MKRLATRLALLGASTFGFAVIGLGGGASAATINVSTQGPNSPVYVNSGHGSYGCSYSCGGSTWHVNENEWNMSDCRGAMKDWSWQKKNSCCAKVKKQNPYRSWGECWNWCVRNCR